jgi:hypothetical protein
MASQTGSVDIKVASKLSNALDLTTAVSQLNETFSVALANGTGLNQANMTFADVRSILTATNEDLDFSGGLSSALGASIVFTKIKLILLVANKTNTGNLTVIRPAANGVPFLLAASDGFTLKPGGVFLLADPSDAGITVTAATGDLINVANASGATQSYTVIVIGVV